MTYAPPKPRRIVPKAEKTEKNASPTSGTTTSRDLGLQAKFVIGSPNDPLEREADALAVQVVGTSVPARRSAAIPTVQRENTACTQLDDKRPQCKLIDRAASSSTSAPPGFATLVNLARKSGGRPLGSNVRTSMEAKFAADFSSVRIHDGDNPDALARGVGSRAFTIGRDIFFARGEFRPGGHAGDRLLAHELTHVLQQHDACSSEKRIVRRAIRIDAQAAALTMRIVEPDNTETESAPWLDEIVYGINTFLGLGVKISKLSKAETTLQYDGEISGFPERLNKLIDQRFGTRVMMPRAGKWSDRESPDEDYREKDKDAARDDFEYVQSIVRHHLQSEDVNVRTRPGARHPVEFRDGEVQVDPAQYPEIAVFRRTLWDGFWVFVHELLHKGSKSHRVLRDDMRQSSLGAQPEPYWTRKTVDLRNVSGERPKKKPEPRLWSQIGQPEEKLNVVRFLFGLPLRTGYSESEGSQTIIRFSDDTQPPGTVGGAQRR